MEAEFVGNFCSVHSVGQILLVGEHEQESITKFVLVQHPLQFLTCLGDTFSVIGVDDKDDALSVLEIVPPEWTDLVLTTDIPYSEGDVFVLDSLHIEPDSWDGGNDLAKLQLVKDGSFPSSVESDLISDSARA
jgi:hypothetical protein